MRNIAILLAALLLTTGAAAAARPDLPGAGDRERGERPDRERDDRDDRDEKGSGDRGHGKARFAKHSDKWVLQNDDITIWFHQGHRSKPALAVFHTGEDGNKTGFKLVLDELFEARAAPPRNASHDDDDGDDGDDEDDGDGAPFHRVRGHRVNLHPAREWWTSVRNGTDEVTITMAHLFNQGNVSLVFHVPRNGSQVKFDVKVQDWRWADANNTLALRLKVLERNATPKGGDNATFTGGFVGWATTADVTYPNGTKATIPVEGEVRNKGGGARILLRFNGTGGYSLLDYDPVIGIQGASMQPVPGFAAFAAVGALGLAAAVAVARRPRP